MTTHYIYFQPDKMENIVYSLYTFIIKMFGIVMHQNDCYTITQFLWTNQEQIHSLNVCLLEHDSHLAVVQTMAPQTREPAAAGSRKTGLQSATANFTL